MDPQSRTHRSDELSLIVPVFNEPDNLPKLVAEVEKYVPAPFVMYVIYDFDEDTTLPVARALSANRPWLRLVRNDLGRGVVFALRTGFHTVRHGPALVVMADLSDDLRVVPTLLSLYGQGFRIVCPSRYMRGGRQIGGPIVKGLISRAAGLTLHYLAGFPTHDATNNFRLYDAALVNQLGISSTGGFEVALELTAKAFRLGVPIAEVPAVWRDRTAGESRFELRKWLPKYVRWYRYAFLSAWAVRRDKHAIADERPAHKSKT
jgi:dolichol-phosphate mannosyltransferase